MTRTVTDDHAGRRGDGMRGIALALIASAALLLALPAAGWPSGSQGYGGTSIEAAAGGDAVTAGLFRTRGHRLPVEPGS